MKLSMCIVGCGGYARTVLRDIHDMTDELRLFFASRDVDKAKAYCEEYGGAGYFGDYEEAVASPDVQAAYFFTPHHLHLEGAQLAARHSKHILMEKPIARTLDESSAIILAAEEAGSKLMVAENYRFLPTVQRAKKIIAEGHIGVVRLVQIHAESFRAPTDWRTSAELTGGGVFIDAGIHMVDVLLTLAGFPERVSAAEPRQVHRGAEGEDGLVMMATMPEGAVGLINLSRATPIGSGREFVQVTGSKGQMNFVPYGNEITVETPMVKRTVSLPEAHRGVRGMVAEFRSAVLEDREPAMNGREGLRDLAVVLAAYQSVRERREVSVVEPTVPQPGT